MAADPSWISGSLEHGRRVFAFDLLEACVMKTDHPTVEDFENFLRSVSSPAIAQRNALVMRHLLADCSACRLQLTQIGWGEERLDRLFRPASEHGEESETARRYDYSKAFQAAEESLAAFFAEGRPAESTPEELMAELAPLPLEEQARWVASYARFANPQLIKRLVESSHALRYDSPARLLHLANLARLAADACSMSAAGSAPRLADLRSHAYRQYANGLRVAGRLREAEEAFRTASRFCAEGTGDPPLRAWLYEQMVSLRISQRRFEEAIKLADEAGRIYCELGETQSEASSFVQKAIALIYSGEPEAAVRILNQTIPRIDREGDPYLLVVASHNLIRCYIDLERPEQALSIYFEARDLYREFKDSLISLRAGWQEGQLLRDLGHLRAAEEALLRARQGFLDRELSYDAAVVSLDLAAVYLKLDETEKLRQAVIEMTPIFTALGVNRDALAALLQLQQVDHQSRQAYELIRFLNTQLEQLPHRHTLK
jgi:tetratricopeptide (TPR) repeat protein